MAKILYVEGNDDDVYMLRSRLERKGYEVLIAGDGEQGIAVAKRERPDLILLDLSLPVMDGWEAARHSKGGEDTSAIPVIALTAHAMSGTGEKHYQWGVTTTTPSQWISNDCSPRLRRFSVEPAISAGCR